ncbi:hypothetical protein C8R44DRAFT_793991, partial [Mycena epipterygia]
MPASLHFILGFILGVLWTFGCFVVQPVAKIKLASLAVFPVIPTSSILHVLIFANLAVLNVVLIVPRLRSLGRLAKQRYLSTFTGSANPAASPLAFKTFIRHLSPIPVFNVAFALSVHLYRAAILVIGLITTLIRVLAVFIWNHIPFASILNGIRIVPRLRSIARLIKERKVPFTGFKQLAFPTSVVHLTVASLVILYRTTVSAIVFIVGIIRSSALFIWDHIPFLVGQVRSLIPARGKTAFHDDSSVADYDDEVDITLVDESRPQSPSNAAPPVIAIKKTLTLRTSPPAFWSPGGHAIRIVAP